MSRALQLILIKVLLTVVFLLGAVYVVQSFAVNEHKSVDQPSLYEFYTAGGITEGLSSKQPFFTLNTKNITIHSGAIHYFRIPRKYWRDRLQKLRAAGLNTVETYIAWNLHEAEEGQFDFGTGTGEQDDITNIREFLKIAQEEDLLVILRPGPYICAEWEWGGFPSWLLRYENIKVRTSDEKYISHVRTYFNELLKILWDLQFTKGGPVIAFQVENEYASSPTIDRKYLENLVEIYQENNITELLVTADGAGSLLEGTLPGTLLQTVNFGSNPEGALDALAVAQPQKPFMVMEYWNGWFDHWSEKHHMLNSEDFRANYRAILSYPASVNLYMFHGGTNWGFLNGANYDDGYAPTTTSYDYDGPLSEAGDYTDKYQVLREVMEEFNVDGIYTPDPPQIKKRIAYETISVTAQLAYEDIIANLPMGETTAKPLMMELLDINNNNGQSYGYIVYRHTNLTIPKNSVLRIDGKISDTVMVVLNRELVSGRISSSEDLDGFGYWRTESSILNLPSEELTGATLDIIVENLGRVNFGYIYTEFKGLKEENVVYLNDVEITDWFNIPLEFTPTWTNSLEWGEVDLTAKAPALYKAILDVGDDEDLITDTYINMEDWSKGIVIVNGFVLGRHFLVGPQQALYLPAPFLKPGHNEIIIFEQFTPVNHVKFSEDQIFYNR